MGKKRSIGCIIGILCITLMAGIMFVYAAPSNTRGRVAVDIGDFAYVDHDGGRARGLSDEGNGTKYKLYYENYMISNHDNDGVTYRSKKTYDMTDVVKLEFSAYTQTNDSDKFMIYTTSSDYKTFHGKDRDDIKDSMYDGQSPAVSGKVYSFSTFSKQISKNVYSTDFHYKNFNTDSTYENRYVYIAMSKAFDWAKQGIMLQNNTYMQNSNGEQVAGGITLKLKEHKVQLLAAEKPKRIDIDNNEVTNSMAYSDLEMKMNDGEAYALNKKASLYRDEEIVLSYKWGAGVTGKVVGYNFYADAEKKTKLYRMNTNSGTIKFNADLIQDIEKTSGKDLGDFYLEPIFQYDQATIKVSDSVAETDNLEIKKSASNDYDYQVIDKTAGNATVGTIHLNKAKYIGDYLRIDYEENADYHGDYAISSFLLALCETAEQVNTTTNTALFGPDPINVDYNQQIQNKYIRILPRIKLHAEVKLEDKKTTFSNSKVQIDPAEVTYPEGAMRPPGANKITYQYYTDEDCQTLLEGDYPINRGVYYVIATMPEDTDYYAKAVSNKAVLEILPAVPTLKNVHGNKAITYGENLNETEGVDGDAYGVEGTKISGTFAWAKPEEKPEAGYRKAEVEFTPTGIYTNNYTNAKGTGLVTVKADSVTVTVEERVCTYNGQPVTPSKVSVTGNTTGQPTGQSAELTYYADSDYKTELPNIPVYAGGYFILASVSASENYNGGTGKGQIRINKAPVNLIQVPYKDENMEKGEYRVYIQGAEVLPHGRVTLDVTYSGGSYVPPPAEIREDKEGRFYAAFDGDKIKEHIPTGENVEAAANYSCKTGYEDYYADTSVQEFYDGELAAICTETYSYGDNTTHQHQWEKEKTFTDTGLTFDENLTLNTFVKNTDVAEINLTDKDRFNETVYVKPMNAGRTYVLTRFVRNEGAGKTASGFLMYEFIVKKAPVTVDLKESKTAIYDGHPVTMDGAVAHGGPIEIGDPLPDDMQISYCYYSDEACKKLLAGPPTDPGTYYVIAKTNETRNFEAGESQPATLTIEKAPAEISMKSMIVKYDGEPHKLDPAVVKGSVSALSEEDAGDIQADDVFVKPTGKVTYVYTDQNGNQISNIDRITEAGRYTVTASLTDDPIYKDVTLDRPAYLLIVPENAKLTIADAEKVYDGLPVEPKITFEVEGEQISVPEEVYVEYGLKILAGNNVKKGLPVQAGNYYTRAAVDKGNYWNTFSNLGEVSIRRADVALMMEPDYEAEYSGAPVVFDDAKAVSQGRDITEEVTITYEYYEDREGRQPIEAPQYPGTYYVKAFSKGTRNYKPTESEIKKIVIKKRPVYLSELKIHSAGKVTGKAKNKEGVLVPGNFYIADTESFWMLPEGEHQVEVEFVPDTEASRIYYGETGFAPYTIATSDDLDDERDPDGEDPGNERDSDGDDERNSNGKNPDGDKADRDGNGTPDRQEDRNRNGIPDDEEKPDTGDHNMVGFYLLLAVMALLNVIILKKTRKIER